MVKTNRDIIGDQYIRNNDSMLAVSDRDKKIDWKSMLLWEAFEYKVCVGQK